MSDAPHGLLLVVEDDPRVARFVVRGLREEGFTVDVCEDGESAIKQGLALPYDLALLDWSLPGLDGVTVMRRWRAEGMQAPIIMLTARTGVEATVLALDEGADDYISKPFRFEELLARVRAHLRRARLDGEAVGRVQIGGATLDPRRRTIELGGAQSELSSREYALLDCLLRHRGQVISRSRILDQVWGLSHDPTTNVVDVYVRYLRQKLDGEGVPVADSCIETVRGRGYRLREQPT